jgi:hypothetical protein
MILAILLILAEDLSAYFVFKVSHNLAIRRGAYPSRDGSRHSGGRQQTVSTQAVDSSQDAASSLVRERKSPGLYTATYFHSFSSYVR